MAATNQAPAKNAPPPPPPQVFRVGTYATEYNDQDATVTMTTGQVNYPNFTIGSNGWLRGLYFLFECVTSSNAATTVFKADAPFSAIAKIAFLDVGGREIFGPLGGFDWATLMAFGGYHNIGDPRSDLAYSVTAGSGGTGGSFTMVMYLPLEIVGRDALGDIENKSTSSSFRVVVVLDASTNIYTTAPTTLGTVRLRIVEDGYTEPEAADAQGRPLSQAPPAVGTVQYWTSEPASLNAGAAKYNVQNGISYSIRNLIFKLSDNTGSRAQGDADWPDPVTLSYGKIQLFQRYQKIWNSRQGKAFGLTNTTADSGIGALVATSPATLSRFNGVYPVWFTGDFDLAPGAELRNGYLVTKSGTALTWAGTINGSGTHTLNVLSNYIVSPGNDPARLRASR